MQAYLADIELILPNGGLGLQTPYFAPSPIWAVRGAVAWAMRRSAELDILNDGEPPPIGGVKVHSYWIPTVEHGSPLETAAHIVGLGAIFEWKRDHPRSLHQAAADFETGA